jgi:di/tricarboxylate transporter
MARIILLEAFITRWLSPTLTMHDDTLLLFAGLFSLFKVCAALSLLAAFGKALARYIEFQDKDQQLKVAIMLILWVVSAITSTYSLITSQ